MSNIKADGNLNLHDIESIAQKRIVFIVDEAHRSTFGDMLKTIKKHFRMQCFWFHRNTYQNRKSKKDEYNLHNFR